MGSSLSEPTLALVCAVAREAEPLLDRLGSLEPLTIGRRAAHRGRLDDCSVLLVVGGVGKTNAAQAVTALLERHAPRAALGFGVAGAYPASGLDIAGIALADAEIYADEGVESPDGWLSPREMGFPLLTVGDARYFHAFPVDRPRTDLAERARRAAGPAPVRGAFLTVSTCSGTARRGRELAERHGAVCETMEGAALAHVCALYQTPFVHVRAISNAVEDRDLSRWRLAEAADACAEAVERIAPALLSEPARPEPEHTADPCS